MNYPVLNGLHVPLVTPMHETGAVDYSSLKQLVNFHTEKGSDGLWLLGTTGEFIALNTQARADLLERVVGEMRSNLQVTVNVTAASTACAIDLATHSATVGVDAVAVMPPFYFVHNEKELVRHFEEIKNAIGNLPLIVYNYPQMTKVGANHESLVDLAANNVIAGLKDTSNDLQWFRRLSFAIREFRDDFSFLLGSRILVDLAALVGATGVVPAISNLDPAGCSEAFSAGAEGDLTRMTEQARRIVELDQMNDLIGERSVHGTTVSVMKAVLHDRGLIMSRQVSQPFTQLTDREAQLVAHRARKIQTDIRSEE